VKTALDRANCFKLTHALERWKKNGRPEGVNLSQTMIGFRENVVVSNRVFKIHGTNYVTLFAYTNPSSGRSGNFFITTSKIVIWLDASYVAGIYPFKTTRL